MRLFLFILVSSIVTFLGCTQKIHPQWNVKVFENREEIESALEFCFLTMFYAETKKEIPKSVNDIKKFCSEFRKDYDCNSIDWDKFEIQKTEDSAKIIYHGISGPIALGLINPPANGKNAVLKPDR